MLREQVYHGTAQCLAYSRELDLLAVVGDHSTRTAALTISIWQLSSGSDPAYTCSWGQKPFASWLTGSTARTLGLTAQFSAGGRHLLVHQLQSPAIIFSLEVLLSFPASISCAVYQDAMLLAKMLMLHICMSYTIACIVQHFAPLCGCSLAAC